MKINDEVRLIYEPPAEWVRRDLVGRIVEVFHDGREMYEVAFTDDAGNLLAEIAVTPEQIELLSSGPPPQ